MTSRRAFKHHEQKIARALQFEPGHVGGRVASAQPVNRRGGTVRGPAVGGAGAPSVGMPDESSLQFKLQSWAGSATTSTPNEFEPRSLTMTFAAPPVWFSTSDTVQTAQIAPGNHGDLNFNLQRGVFAGDPGYIGGMEVQLWATGLHASGSGYSDIVTLAQETGGASFVIRSSYHRLDWIADGVTVATANYGDANWPSSRAYTAPWHIRWTITVLDGSASNLAGVGNGWGTDIPNTPMALDWAYGVRCNARVAATDVATNFGSVYFYGSWTE